MRRFLSVNPKLHIPVSCDSKTGSQVRLSFNKLSTEAGQIKNAMVDSLFLRITIPEVTVAAAKAQGFQEFEWPLLIESLTFNDGHKDRIRGVDGETLIIHQTMLYGRNRRPMENQADTSTDFAARRVIADDAVGHELTFDVQLHLAGEAGLGFRARDRSFHLAQMVDSGYVTVRFRNLVNVTVTSLAAITTEMFVTVRAGRKEEQGAQWELFERVIDTSVVDTSMDTARLLYAVIARYGSTASVRNALDFAVSASDFSLNLASTYDYVTDYILGYESSIELYDYLEHYRRADMLPDLGSDTPSFYEGGYWLPYYPYTNNHRLTQCPVIKGHWKTDFNGNYTAADKMIVFVYNTPDPRVLKMLTGQPDEDSAKNTLAEKGRMPKSETWLAKTIATNGKEAALTAPIKLDYTNEG